MLDLLDGGDEGRYARLALMQKVACVIWYPGCVMFADEVMFFVGKERHASLTLNE